MAEEQFATVYTPDISRSLEVPSLTDWVLILPFFVIVQGGGSGMLVETVFVVLPPPPLTVTAMSSVPPLLEERETRDTETFLVLEAAVC